MANRQQMNDLINLCVEQQIIRARIFVQRHIFAKAIVLYVEVILTDVNFNRVSASIQKQPPQLGEAFQIRKDGGIEFVKQHIKRLWCAVGKQKALDLFEIALGVSGDFDLAFDILHWEGLAAQAGKISDWF